MRLDIFSASNHLIVVIAAVLLTCNNGVVESGEECDSSEYCVDCVCESGTVSNGTYCLVPGDTIIGPEPKDALIGGIVGGVGGAVVAAAVVLIILAKKGKLKRKKKSDEIRLNDNMSNYVAISSMAVDGNAIDLRDRK